LVVHNPFRQAPYIREYLLGELGFARAIWMVGMLGFACLLAYAVFRQIDHSAAYALSVIGPGLFIIYLVLHYNANAVFAGADSAAVPHPQWKTYMGMTAAFIVLTAMIWFATSTAGDHTPEDFSMLNIWPLWAWFLTMVAMPARYPLPIQILWKRKFVPALFAWGLWFASFATWQLRVLQPAWDSHAPHWTLPRFPTLLLLFACLAFTLTTTTICLLQNAIGSQAPRRTQPQL